MIVMSKRLQHCQRVLTLSGTLNTAAGVQVLHNSDILKVLRGKEDRSGPLWDIMILDEVGCSMQCAQLCAWMYMQEAHWHGELFHLL